MATEDEMTTLKNLDELKASLTNLEILLRPLMDKSLSELSQHLTPLDASKLYATVSYSLSTLFFCYARLEGVNLSQHKIMDELKRIKESMGKIAATAKELEKLSLSDKK